MRFGQPQCIRCTMVGHLSYQCGRPILDLIPAEPPQEQKPEPVAADYDQWYDDGSICLKETR